MKKQPIKKSQASSSKKTVVVAKAPRVSSMGRSNLFSPKKMKSGVLTLIAIITMLLVLAKIPATSNLPIVHSVKNLLSHAATVDENNIFDEINSYRTTLGLSRLQKDNDTVAGCAKRYASYLANNTAGLDKIESSLSLPHNTNFLNQSATCTESKNDLVGENLGIDLGHYTASNYTGVRPDGPLGYSLCTYNNGICQLSSPTQVAYGANGKFNYSIESAPFRCNASKLGDPIPGTKKACFILGGTNNGVSTGTDTLYDAVFAEWLTIPEFKANLDNPNFRKLAVGTYYDSNGVVWVVANFRSNTEVSNSKCTYSSVVPVATKIINIGTAMTCVRN